MATSLACQTLVVILTSKDQGQELLRFEALSIEMSKYILSQPSNNILLFRFSSYKARLATFLVLCRRYPSYRSLLFFQNPIPTLISQDIFEGALQMQTV